MPHGSDATSRYAYYDETGAARDVIGLAARPVPRPGEGEVLVEVHRSGINPSDTKRRAGWASYKPRSPRMVLHCDGAGVIVAVGEGVPASRVGERVWLWNAETEGQGTAADHCVVPSGHAVTLPEPASFDVGACLGVPACTAHRAVFADGPVEGQTVLVQGGAGAVGAYAVQFARRAGARVIATGSTPEKRQVALDLGAHVALDYRGPDAAAAILDANGGRGVDRVVEVDLGENLALDLAVAGLNATIASYSSTRVREFAFPYYAIAPKGLNFRIVQGYCLPERAREEAIRDIGAALAEGWLVHRIGAVFPLEEIVAAHEAAERGDSGKVLVALR
ncbi:NADPH:quinone reductase [Alsobacter sp. SYSU M60028]|uniref:NADPH:quinone reductase n=1 Tax=Alsobacter ponti TaxID=2962936 RepID=A0ABT1LHM5_9HYPH|nr:NADPH:quinone reductase [Alsobacter ponti]MCP8940373.1 NADPH:quinone reductase [Alsobacter ponti]